MSTSTKVIAFDCDGVLFESQYANTVYYNHILEHFSKPPMTAEQVAYVHMSTGDEAIAFLFGNEKEMIAKVQSYRQSLNYMPFIKHMQIEPSLKVLLDKIHPSYNTAIATNRTDTMHLVLKEFGLTSGFDLVVTSVDVTNPKPHPEQLLKIMDFFEAQPEEILYIGDSEVDQKAAQAAGVPLVAYQNRKLDALYYIDRLADVEKLLQN